MSTFTKEQLIARINQVTAINNYRISRDPDADGLAMDNELFAIALASLEAELVGYFGRFDADDENLIDQCSPSINGAFPLYTAPPAPVAMKDHQIRDLVNELRDIVVEYYGTQQLRERIAKTVRAAMLQGAEQTKYRAIVERIAEIIHGKVTDIDLLTVTVKSMKDKLQK